MGRRTPAGGEAVALQVIERRIYLIRGQKVMLDSDLANLYGVTTGNLNLAVGRNRKRFLEDFTVQLSPTEASSLLLHSASSKGRGGRHTRPYALTEQGVAMLSSVLRSERAIQVETLQELIEAPEPPRRRIGFVPTA